MTLGEEKLRDELTRLEDTLQRVIRERDAAWYVLGRVRTKMTVVKANSRSGGRNHKAAVETRDLVDQALRGEVIR